jgi:hypothetical protein
MRKPVLLLALRAVGALALLAVAADHLYEYYADHYSAIPTIGTLFLLNGAGATALGLILLAPLNSVLPRPAARWALALTASGGIALAAASLAGLFIAETEPLFGFMEAGYRAVIVAAIASEALAILALAPVVLLSWRARLGLRSRVAHPQPAAQPRREEPPGRGDQRQHGDARLL